MQGCALDDGTMLPPYILYGAINPTVSWKQNGPVNPRYNVAEKGWMDSACFSSWFANHFIPFLPEGSLVLLIVDEHAFHLNIKVIITAIQHDVIGMEFPSNSTHLIQPFAVGIYGPVKTDWKSILTKYDRQNLGTTLSKELFSILLRKLRESYCMSEGNIESGFSKCGILSFDASEIPSSVNESAEYVGSVHAVSKSHNAGRPIVGIRQDDSELNQSAASVPSTDTAIMAEPTSSQLSTSHVEQQGDQTNSTERFFSTGCHHC